MSQSETPARSVHVSPSTTDAPSSIRRRPLSTSQSFTKSPAPAWALSPNSEVPQPSVSKPVSTHSAAPATDGSAANSSSRSTSPTTDVSVLKRKIAASKARNVQLQQKINELEIMQEAMRLKLDEMASQELKRKLSTDEIHARLRGASTRQVIEMYEQARESTAKELSFLREQVNKNAVNADIRILLNVDSDEAALEKVQQLLQYEAVVPRMEQWIQQVCTTCGCSPGNVQDKLQKWKETQACATEDREIRHFMQLFDVSVRSEVIPRMNEVYLAIAAARMGVETDDGNGERQKQPKPLRAPGRLAAQSHSAAEE